jgi:hypothetical protein
MAINKLTNKALQVTIPISLYNSINELVGLLKQKGVSITKSTLTTNAIMFYLEYVASLEEQVKAMAEEHGGN